MDFLLRFTLISYASIFFFALGLRFAILNQIHLNFWKLFLIFIAVAIPLSLFFLKEPLEDRIFISLIWTSAIGIGYRFGKKIQKN